MKMSRQERCPRHSRIESLVASQPHYLNVTTGDLVVVDNMGLVNQLRIHSGIEKLMVLVCQFVARTERETMRYGLSDRSVRNFES